MKNTSIQFIPMNSIIGSSQVAPWTLMLSKLLTLVASHQDFGSLENTWSQWNMTQWKWIIRDQEDAATSHSSVGNVSRSQWQVGPSILFSNMIRTWNFYWDSLPLLLTLLMEGEVLQNGMLSQLSITKSLDKRRDWIERFKRLETRLYCKMMRSLKSGLSFNI